MKIDKRKLDFTVVHLEASDVVEACINHAREHLRESNIYNREDGAFRVVLRSDGFGGWFVFFKDEITDEE